MATPGGSLHQRSVSLTVLMPEDSDPPGYPDVMRDNLIAINRNTGDDIEMMELSTNTSRQHPQYGLIPSAPFLPNPPRVSERSLSSTALDSHDRSPTVQQLGREEPILHRAYDPPPAVPPPLPARNDNMARPDDDMNQYYPVLFQPTSGKLYVNVNGFYHALPQQLEEEAPPATAGPSAPLLRPQQDHPDHPTPVFLAEPDRRVKDYYSCTLYTACVMVLCFNLVALGLCLAPALYFAFKAKRLRYNSPEEAAKYGKVALGFDIAAIVLHCLMIVVIVQTVLALLYWVFDIF